ncbi:hypothetical protein Lalb_Chr11g0069581 [Lupinus albus]|uniref:Uncharacterized protein n=1 Tax=Lupinus albus TaxID=3870 RepID=A0A6A4PS12_LUPAL|nr:hypothetical protein Lalb_Chr11g0069581 [Lupinus albus]
MHYSTFYHVFITNAFTIINIINPHFNLPIKHIKKFKLNILTLSRSPHTYNALLHILSSFHR